MSSRFRFWVARTKNSQKNASRISSCRRRFLRENDRKKGPFTEQLLGKSKPHYRLRSRPFAKKTIKIISNHLPDLRLSAFCSSSFDVGLSPTNKNRSNNNYNNHQPNRQKKKQQLERNNHKIFFPTAFCRF